MQLFCLPYSGASAMVYAPWRRALPPWIDVRPVELPGRGARMDEPFATDPQVLAADLAAELRGQISGPYAFLGHSLGALLAFELAHALVVLGAPAPRLLFASATEAPSMRDDADLARPRSDAELVADLRRLNGTPEAVLADAELLSHALPVLRADFLLCGAYTHGKHQPLACPVHVLSGTEDDIDPAALQAWEAETTGGFALDLLPGDHFFIHAQRARVLEIVADALSAVRPPTEGPAAEISGADARGADARRSA